MVALAGSKWRLLVVMIATGCCHKKSNRDGHRWHPALSIAARIPQEIVLLGAPPIGDEFFGAECVSGRTSSIHRLHGEEETETEHT